MTLYVASMHGLKVTVGIKKVTGQKQSFYHIHKLFDKGLDTT